MGCGHSKISINPKKSRTKNSCKKIGSGDNNPSVEDDENNENESELSENLDDCDQKKTIRVKPVGGPLSAQLEISSSQQNFFKMLDEKIENGPDYDSSSETERAAEAARLNALLKDWETASAGSRSLPATPKRRVVRPVRASSEATPHGHEPNHRFHPHHQQQQPLNYAPGYGYRQPGFNYEPPLPVPVYYHHNRTQYQQPQYFQHPTYSPKHYPHQDYPPPNPPKPQQQPQQLYTPVSYTNGELLQQQIYNHQMQYQQAREYQHYRQSREQLLIQQQQQQQQHGIVATRNYQSTVHVAMSNQSDVGPLHRKQYELT